jgi:hypothetical protein
VRYDTHSAGNLRSIAARIRRTMLDPNTILTRDSDRDLDFRNSSFMATGMAVKTISGIDISIKDGITPSEVSIQNIGNMHLQNEDIDRELVLAACDWIERTADLVVECDPPWKAYAEEIVRSVAVCTAIRFPDRDADLCICMPGVHPGEPFLYILADGTETRHELHHEIEERVRAYPRVAEVRMSEDRKTIILVDVFLETKLPQLSEIEILDGLRTATIDPERLLAEDGDGNLRGGSHA